MRMTSLVVAVAGLTALAACGERSALTAPGRVPGPSRSISPGTAVGQPGNGVTNEGEVELCKLGAPGTFDVTTSAIVNGSPTNPTVRSYSLNAGQCVIVAINKTTSSPPDMRVGITETSTGFLSVTDTTIRIPTTGPESTTWTTSTTSASVSNDINAYHGGLAVFTNAAPPPPSKKKCDADKTKKDPKVHDENHDCRSESGEKNDPKYTPGT